MPMTAILAQYICDWKRLLYELLYGISNETIYVPSKDSDQTEHLFSLIRVIHVHSMTNIKLSVLLWSDSADQRDRWMQSANDCFFNAMAHGFFVKSPVYQPSLINTKVK